MKTYIILLFVFLASVVYAQNISGVVYESHGKNDKQPLPGVNIYWQNTQNGTVSLTDGSFSISVDNSTDALVFSYIGFENDTLIVKDYSKPVTVLLNENKELSEIVVAERSEGTQISKLAPVYTQCISGSELKKAACCNLSESFETNASVDVSYSDAVTGAKQIQLLGLSGKYVQILTENYPNYGGLANTFGLSYIPGSWMQSISISKGTASVINGYDAMTGQINVEFLKPATADKFYINLFANSAYKFESNIHSSVRLNKKWSTMLLFHNGNNYTEIDHDDDGFLDMPLVQQYHVFNRWDYFNGKGFSWRFGYTYLYEDRLAGQSDFDPDRYRTPANGYGIGIDTRRMEAFSKVGFVLPHNETQSIALISNYSYHMQNSFYGLNTYDASQHSIYGNLIFQTDIKDENHSLSSGVDYRNNIYDEELNYENIGKSESDIGLYTQYTYKYYHKLTALFGLRGDYNSLYGTFFTPRVHMKYHFTENLTTRLSVGKAYRSSNIIAENSTLLASSRTINIAPDIDIEEAWNYGASITKYLYLNKKKYTVSLDFFRTDFINQIVVDLDTDASAIHFYNLLGKSYSNNYQAELNMSPLKGIESTIAFRYSDVKSTYGGKLMQRPLASKYKGLFTISYQTPLQKWQFDFTTQLNGDGRIPSTADNSLENRRPETFDAYTVLNAQITKYFRKWNMYIGSENILGFVQDDPIIDADNPFGNEFDAGMIWGPVDGRKFYVGLRYMIEREQ